MAPHVVDWVYGVIVTVRFFVEDLCEGGKVDFHSFAEGCANGTVFAVSFVSAVIFTTLHLTALCATHWLTTFCFTYAKGLRLENNPYYEGKLFGETTFYSVLISFVGIGIGIGVVPSLIIVLSLGSPLAHRFSGLFHSASEAGMAMDPHSNKTWALRRIFVPFLTTPSGGQTGVIRVLVACKCLTGLEVPSLKNISSPNRSVDHRSRGRVPLSS
ncbi:hypothetical protein FA13DRAFT_1731031 [Coprinellus micaceus]|uniref:Uncharacterized protein n=1 Tax=Coprinellus micaceus TaxID=71717 RepID=A0A4Y7TGF8_COPMI|nr:hypothetical protein FA13DRAFT_1731031 [Coprinellus micaceus]